MKFIIVFLLLFIAVVVRVQTAPLDFTFASNTGDNGILQKPLEEIRKILNTILSPELSKTVVDLIEALLTGKSIGDILNRLVSTVKTLVDTNGLAPGVLGLAKGFVGQLTGINAKASEAQLIQALDKIRAVLSHFANPKLVNVIIGIISQLSVGGPIGGLLTSIGGLVGGVLGQNNSLDGLTGNGGPLNGFPGDSGLFGGLLNGFLGNRSPLSSVLGW